MRPVRQLLCSRDAKRTVLISIVTATANVATSAIKNVKKKHTHLFFITEGVIIKTVIFYVNLL